MQVVSLTKAKVDFERLVEKVISGEVIVITKYGKPVSQLVRYTKSQKSTDRNAR